MFVNLGRIEYHYKHSLDANSVRRLIWNVDTIIQFTIIMISKSIHLNTAIDTNHNVDSERLRTKAVPIEKEQQCKIFTQQCNYSIEPMANNLEFYIVFYGDFHIFSAPQSF